MNEIVKKQRENAVIKLTLIFATFGSLAALSLAVVLLGFVGFGELASEIFVSFFAAIFGLYAAAMVLGKIASRLICGINNTDSRIWLIGLGVAWGCLLVSVLAGSSVQFFAGISASSNLSEAFFDYILKPVFWIMPIGSVAALILGLIYAAQLKRIFGNVND